MLNFVLQKVRKKGYPCIIKELLRNLVFTELGLVALAQSTTAKRFSRVSRPSIYPLLDPKWPLGFGDQGYTPSLEVYKV